MSEFDQLYREVILPGALPSMIQDDRYTVVVDKAAGTSPFEDALAWATWALAPAMPP